MNKNKPIIDIYLSGNNGGDYIKIIQNKQQKLTSCCYIEIGHCCVVILQAQVPIEFITSLFWDFMIHNQEGFSRKRDDKLNDFAKEILKYQDKNFLNERLSQIKEI